MVSTAFCRPFVNSRRLARLLTSSRQSNLLLRHLATDATTTKRDRAAGPSRLNLKQLREAWGAPSFDVSQMTEVIDHDCHDMRRRMRTFLSQSAMAPRYNIALDVERELALSRLKQICDAGFISVHDFRSDPRRIFTAHELTAIVDSSTATKMTVQFNLFGGTVLKLGTARHHERLLAGIDTLDDVGCFGLTELGYGNNAVEMETTATYDRSKQEFIVNSPTPLAQKYVPADVILPMRVVLS